MPCNDYSPEEERQLRERDEAFRENSNLESLLCSACRLAEFFGFSVSEQISSKVGEWFEEHKLEDQKRLQLEEVQEDHEDQVVNLSRKDFSKLSLEQRNFLMDALSNNSNSRDGTDEGSNMSWDEVERKNEELRTMIYEVCVFLENEGYMKYFALNPRLDEFYDQRRRAVRDERFNKAIKRIQNKMAREIASTKKVVDMDRQEKNLVKQAGLM